MRAGLALVCLSAAFAAAPAAARVVEEQLDLPVQVTDAYGKTVAQPIKLTVFRDDAAAGPQPAVVIQHGRAGDAQERASAGRFRYGDISRWFVRHGFVVALPTRIGYGASGGEDVEDTGPCGTKRYGPGFAAVAQQTLAVLDALRQRPDVKADRLVLLGQSFGGGGTVAAAALNPAGVVAAVNFAGGGGGDPKGRPGNPCSPQQLERTFADYGAKASVPMLWVYTENDRYWGANLPRAWADAYRAAGGDVRFVQMPAFADDGHTLFARGPQLWQPVVAEFLRARGFAMEAATPDDKP